MWPYLIQWQVMSGRKKSPLRLAPITPEACGVDLRLDILSRLPFFDGLSSVALEEINRLFRDHGYLAGEAIYYAGDPADALYVVAAGRVKLARHTLGGQDVLLDVLGPADFFGHLTPATGEGYPDTATALTAACVLRVGGDDFRSVLARFPSVALSLLDITARRLLESQELIRQLSADSAEQRVAHALLRLSEKLGEPSEVGTLIQMPLSREDLADMTGTTTETASRVMSHFQKQQLIQSGRQWVAITNADGLRALTEAE
jgi:CRP-like cAMP-binding protein